MKQNVIKILICFFFIILTSAALSVSNTLGVHLLYFTPISIFLSIILIISDSNSNEEDCFVLRLIVVVLGVVCMSIFMGVFFGLFHPLFSLKLEEIQNCKVVGVLPMANFLQYAILYVEFEYENQSFIGYSCKTGGRDFQFDYTFVENTSTVPCINLGPSYDFEKNRRVLDQKSDIFTNKRKRILKKRGACINRGKSGITSSYNFSKIRLPNWFCLDHKIEFEELIKPKTCYLNFYGDPDQSYQNSKNKENLKQISNFAMIIFSNPPYYPKDGYYCLIIFAYVPFLLLYYPFTVIIFDAILNIINKSKYYKNLHISNKVSAL